MIRQPSLVEEIRNLIRRGEVEEVVCSVTRDQEIIEHIRIVPTTEDGHTISDQTYVLLNTNDEEVFSTPSFTFAHTVAEHYLDGFARGYDAGYERAESIGERIRHERQARKAHPGERPGCTPLCYTQTGAGQHYGHTVSGPILTRRRDGASDSPQADQRGGGAHDEGATQGDGPSR